MRMKDSIFTATGDRRRVAKCSNVASAIGAIDEANAFIGLAKVFTKTTEVKEALEKNPETLF